MTGGHSVGDDVVHSHCKHVVGAVAALSMDLPCTGKSAAVAPEDIVDGRRKRTQNRNWLFRPSRATPSCVITVFGYWGGGENQTTRDEILVN